VTRLWAVLVAVTMVVAGLTFGGRPAAAAPLPLVGGGESWEQILMSKLQDDGQSAISPFVPEYDGIGSVPARKAVIDGTADYAVSEVPPTADEQAQATAKGRTLAVVPYVAGGMAFPFRIVLASGDDLGSLQLTVPTLAKLFTSKISDWRDAQIAADNGSALIPATNNFEIVVRRDSNSSTAALISLFLSDPAASATWNTYAARFGVPAGTLLESFVDTDDQHLPTITGGCADVVRKVAGLDPVTRQPDPSLRPEDLGYCSTTWTAGVPTLHNVAVKNPAGQFVLPTSASIAKQFAGATIDPATNVVKLPYGVTDPEAYPAPVVSYLVVPVTGLVADKAKALASFIRFVLTDAKAKQDAVDLGFAPANPDWVTAGLKVATQLEQPASTTTSTTTTTAAATARQTPLASPASSGSASNGSSGTSGDVATASLPNTGWRPRWPLVVSGLGLLTVGEAVRHRAGRQRRGRTLR
jgi:phosphate transport system substrate-binding protein